MNVAPMTPEAQKTSQSATVARRQEADDEEELVEVPMEVDCSPLSASSSSSSASPANEAKSPTKAAAGIVPAITPETVASRVPRREPTELTVLQNKKQSPASAIPRSRPK